MNYILVDYENVQIANLNDLDPEHCHIIVFINSNQGRLKSAWAQAAQVFGGSLEYVVMHGEGKNALDFYIACYLGECVAQNPKAFFYIVTKDRGFNPLVRHMYERGIAVARIGHLKDTRLCSEGKRMRLRKVTQQTGKIGRVRPRKEFIESLRSTFSLQR